MSKIFDITPKHRGPKLLNHKFVAEDNLEEAIKEHKVDTTKYDVQKISLDEFISICAKYDKYFGQDPADPDERRDNFKDYHGVLLLTNVDY